MKKIYFAALTLLSVVMVACGGGTTSPQVFNNTAINSFEKAGEALDEFDAKLTECVKGDNLADVPAAVDAALVKVDAQIERLNALNNPKGEEFKQSVMVCMDIVKELLEIGRKYASLGEGYSNSEFNALEKEYNAKRMELSKALQTVGEVQSAFAKSVSGN